MGKIQFILQNVQQTGPQEDTYSIVVRNVGPKTAARIQALFQMISGIVDSKQKIGWLDIPALMVALISLFQNN